jgi:hypothetical protein
MAEKQKKQKKKTIFTTSIIDKILDDLNHGILHDDNPFYQGDSQYKEAYAPFEMTDWEYNEYIKCSVDAVYFVENYVPFENDHGVTLVKLRDYQKKFIHLITDEIYDTEYKEFMPKIRNLISMMSRQNAKTTTMCSCFIWYMIFHKSRHLAIVANKDTTVVEIFRKMDEMMKRLPWFLKPGIIAKSMHGMSFDNGCFVQGFATSKTPAIGFTVHFLYIDEAALIPKNIMNDFWTAIYPTLSSSRLSKIVLTSTPRGRQNKFYELWHKGETGQNSFVTYRVDWWQNPDHDEAWAAQQRKDFGEVEFAQEFELQWDVAASKVIRGSDMQYMNRFGKIFVNVDIPSIPKDICKNFYWDPAFDPTSYDNFNSKFFLSIDTAEGKYETVKGKPDSDYNVINIFRMELMNPGQIRLNALDRKISISDCFRFRQVGVYMDNNKDEEEMAKAAKYLTYNTFRTGYKNIDNVRILVEMNFNGKNWLNKYMDDNNWYDSLVLKTHHTKPVPGKYTKKLPGFKTTAGGNGIGKSYFCDKGADMITKRQLIILQQNQNDNLSTVAELGAFDKIKKSESSNYYVYAGIGMHDDLAYTALNCSRATEIEDFNLWLQEYLESGMPPSTRRSKVMRMLEIASQDIQDEISDADFSEVYTGAQRTEQYQKTIHQWQTPSQTNPYMGRGNSNPYMGRGSSNPYLGKGTSNPYLGSGGSNPYLGRNRR